MTPKSDRPTPPGDAPQPHVLTVAQAQALIAQWVPRVSEMQTCPLHDALGRVLARDVVSPIHVPAHDNSAMDGYALRSCELPAHGDGRFSVAGTCVAGQPFSGSATPGQCVRIMTGAVMPAGFDTVVPQENVQIATDGTVIGLYARPLDIDGTADAEVPEAARPTHAVGSFVVNNVNTAQTMRLLARDLPKLASYYLHNNGTGQTISSGWTLKVTPYGLTPKV